MIVWLLQHIPTETTTIALVVGIIACFVGGFLPVMYSAPTRLAGIIIVLISMFLLGVNLGANELSEEVSKANEQIAKIKDESKKVTKQVVVKYVEKQKIIKENGNEIVKFITKNNDADCTLHNSFVELHDSAAKNSIPDPTRRVDEASSGIDLSQATEAIVKNYNQYNQVAEQLKSLQEWIKMQQEINK